MKKINLVTKFVLCSCLIGASAIHADTELTESIKCKGTLTNTAGQKQNLVVKGNPEKNTLNISIFTGSHASAFDTQSLRITQVIPMFPVYSVIAQRDRRPVDGTLTVAKLRIKTEGISTSGGGMPAKLTLDVTSPRGFHSTKTYPLSCKISNN